MNNPRKILASVALLSGLSSGYLACGGDDSTVTPTDDGGSDATVDTGLPDTTLPDTSLPDTSSSDTSVPDTSTGDSGKDGGGTDGASDAPVDSQLNPDTGNTLGDAGPGGDGAVLSCGSAQCALPAETCCIYEDLNPPPPFYVACANGAACPLLLDAGFDASPPVALQCESQANCQGALTCCITSTMDGGSISAHCSNSCNGGESNALLCDPTAADAGCPADAGCSTSNIGTWRLPAGFGTCGGKVR